MKVIELLRCSRPVLFESADKLYPYYLRGSGFLCRLGEKLAFVTACHVVRDTRANELAVQYHPEKRDFLPHTARIVPRALDLEDTDQTDIAIYPIDQELIEWNLFENYQPVSLIRERVSERNLDGKTLICRGFPADRNGIDYDLSKVSQQGVILEARYRETARSAHCDSLEFLDVSVCSTLDCLSGSPVFAIDAEQNNQWSFAGMIIRASWSSRRATYISGERIFSVLSCALK